MPELTHDAEDGFHEIQLSGKQLVFLFMATTVVSVVIFLCGVLVGRGVRAERGDETAVAAAPSPTQPEAAAAPAAQPADPPTPPVEEPLSYPERLQSPKPLAEQLKKPAESEAAVPPAPPPASAQQKPAPTPEPPRSDVPTNGRPGSWVIQVHALQNREAASTFVKTLATNGYPAFLQNPAAGAPQIYRVQIGGYRDRTEAEQVARRLEKEEQFKPAIKRR